MDTDNDLARAEQRDVPGGEVATMQDPGFAAFWAVFPRKDRKIEARCEWRLAAKRYGAERVILAAAFFCAEARRKPRDEIPTAAAWLTGLTEPPRRDGIFGLDPEKVGKALLAACFASRHLGHSTVAATVRDYIAPHGRHDAESGFVDDVLVGRNPQEIISDAEMTEWVGATQGW
jgi:hypothetical protein